MKRILLDTSVYGKLVDDTLLFALLLESKKNHVFVVYGADLIRKELRATPKNLRTMAKEKNVRIFGLSLYDSLITKDNHTLKMNSIIGILAQLYFREYRRQGGNFSNKEMQNDFLIVSCATIHQLDIVISDDKRTMLSEAALRAYQNVNKKMGFNNPQCLLYTHFKEKMFKRSGI